MSRKNERISAEVAQAITDRLDRFERYATNAKNRAETLFKTQHHDWAMTQVHYWSNVLSAIKWLRVRDYELEMDENDVNRRGRIAIQVSDSAGGE